MIDFMILLSRVNGMSVGKDWDRGYGPGGFIGGIAGGIAEGIAEGITDSIFDWRAVDTEGAQAADVPAVPVAEVPAAAPAAEVPAVAPVAEQ